MGMRTALISITRVDLTEFGLGYKYYPQFFHNQWGYGKVMPMAFLSQIFRSYSKNRGYGESLRDVNNESEKFKTPSHDVKIKRLHEIADEQASFFKFDMNGTDYITIDVDEHHNTGLTAREFSAGVFNEKRMGLGEYIQNFIDKNFDNDCGAMVIINNIKLTSLADNYYHKAEQKPLDDIELVHVENNTVAFFISNGKFENFDEYFTHYQSSNGDDGRQAILNVIKEITPIFGNLDIHLDYDNFVKACDLADKNQDLKAKNMTTLNTLLSFELANGYRNEELKNELKQAVISEFKEMYFKN